MENTAHFVLQAKGGIGKTLVSSWLSQWIETKAPRSLEGYDADQENATFHAYKGLNVLPVDVMRQDRTIDRKRFDAMLLKIFDSRKNTVVDVGANTFSPLMSYLMENNFLQMLQESGKKVYVHTIIGGGDNLKDTTGGFVSLARQTDVPMIVWLNENAAWGDTENFIESDTFGQHAGHVRGVILLQGRNSDTFGDDIRRMNKERLTLAEIMKSEEFSVLERSRLNTVIKDVFGKLDKVDW